MAVEVSAVRHVVGADSAQFEAGMQRAAKHLQGAAKAGDLMGTAIAGLTIRLAGFAAAYVGVAGAVKAMQAAVGDTTAIARLSQATGITTERLSELRFAAGQVGVTFEEFGQAVSGMNEKLRSAMTSGISETARQLAALGVSVRDSAGNLRNFDDLLPDIADAFSQYADGAAKAQAASLLFGQEAGPKLVPLLNQGRDGIARYSEEARRLGLTISRDQVRAADDYQKATARLNESFAALSRELTLSFAPAITAAANAVTRAVAGMRENVAGLTAPQLIARADELRARLAGISTEIAKIADVPVGARPSDGAALRLTQLQTLATDTEERLKAVVHALTMLTRTEGGEERPPMPGLPNLEAAKFELQEFMTVVSGQGTLLESMNVAWMTHAEVIEEAQRRIRAAYGATEEARRQLANVERQINLQYEAGVKQVAQTAASTLTALFPKQKGAAVAAAILNTAVAVTEAMKLPFPLNWAQVALVTASGIAQINAIRSTSVSGGGSVPGAGGGGGAVATPTEPAAVAQSQALQISIAPGRYSHQEVEAIIEGINERVQNGVTLISTTTGAR